MTTIQDFSDKRLQQMTTYPCTDIVVPATLLFGINFQYSHTMYVPLHSVAETSVYPCPTYNIHLYVHNV